MLVSYLSADRDHRLRSFNDNRSAIGKKNNQIAENDLKCKYSAVFLSGGSEGFVISDSNARTPVAVARARARMPKIKDSTMVAGWLDDPVITSGRGISCGNVRKGELWRN